MKTKNLIILLLSVIAIPAMEAFAEIPTGYYNTLEGKTSNELKTAVQSVILKHTRLTYNSLWQHFNKTDRTADGKYFWDMYSDTQWTTTYGMNREHSFPKSWWGGSTEVDAYTDINHLYPADYDANMAKSNYPLGIVNKSNITFTNGVSTVGSPITGNGGGSGKVFEPDDRYKGDFARTYFYMVTIYQDYTWRESYSWMLEQDLYPTLKPWAYKMLLEWSRQDPVSQKEIDRNNAVYAIQKNRNPFIDFPGLEEYIWGNKRGQAFHVDGADTPGDPTLLMPTPNMTYDFGNVVVGKTSTIDIQIRGSKISNKLSVLIYGTDKKLFSIKESSNPQSTSINASLINATEGYTMSIDYTPNTVGKNSAYIMLYDGGLATSVVVNLEGMAVAVPELSAPTALDATNVTGTSYQANWTSPEGEDIDYYIVTRTIYKNGEKYTGEFIAEENYYQFNDLEAGTTHSYNVQSVRLGYRSPMSNTIMVAPGGVEGSFNDVGLAVNASEGQIEFICPQPHTGVVVTNLSGQIVARIEAVDNGDTLQIAPGLYYLRTDQTRTPIAIIVR